MKPRAFDDEVRKVLQGIARGTIMTYGEVALESGYPGASRAVGSFMARGTEGLPWWRVVTASGRLVPGNEREHAERLRAEGVHVVDGHVRMSAARRGRSVD